MNVLLSFTFPFPTFNVKRPIFSCISFAKREPVETRSYPVKLEDKQKKMQRVPLVSVVRKQLSELDENT